jgi:hypothetical protein
MNPFLADLYNTAENIGAGPGAADDTEKLAQAAVIDQMLQNEGFSLDQLSPDDLVKVATEIFGAESPLVKEAGEMPFPPKAEKCKKCDKEECTCPAEKEKEAQEKLAEADFLGRAMAHAYVDELSNIEKKAGEQAAPEAPAAPEKTAASAIELLAHQRAEELVKQAQANQDPQAQLEAAVQARAHEILKEAGYTVE